MSPEIIFQSWWSLTFHQCSIFNLNVFEFNWMVLCQQVTRRQEKQQRLLRSENTCFFLSFYSSVWICSHSRLDANHVLRPLQSPACTYFVTAACHSIHCKGNSLAQLNDTTTSIEFSSFFFPWAFASPKQTDLPFSTSSILLCWFVYWDYHLHWSPEDYCLASLYRGFRCTFPTYSLFFVFRI